MKHNILPKDPVLTPQSGHAGLWTVLTVISVIIRVILRLADRDNDNFGTRRD